MTLLGVIRPLYINATILAGGYPSSPLWGLHPRK